MPDQSHASDGPVGAGFPDVQVPVGGAAIDPLGPSLWSTTGPATLRGVTVTYDLKGVSGVRITPVAQGGGDCATPSPARVVCTDPRGLSFEGETVEAYLPVEVSASRSARPGDTGEVTITVTADGLTPITGVSEVRVLGRRDDLPVTGPAAGWSGALLLAAGVMCLLGTRRRRRIVPAT
ncbi:hypothetical protein Aph02nite_64520 [Actinoplanes philippinensis]|uniref:LPXTG-motif cell wall anchor domain-containing protein n=1 Tax=Actinoplanes philippinensis TaxID=35752 RepID=A0A1I2LL00_9ACTN|nr:hypothetical protein [Actinoplanes philippinensis]GIE80502.1 hypothetical protein Aph02nite_64520 [Actinoplanes philippinensis]SFF77761.1 hypothetical protein SAMN05421541_121122 [Actinoplanes philippinensis]